jgi:hypothetical protein
MTVRTEMEYMQNQVSVAAMVQRFCDVMNDISRKTFAEKYPRLVPMTFEFERGNRYYKITNGNGSSRSVFAFVDRDTGDIYKPATFKAPAKGVRFNIYKDFLFLQKNADIYGSFLYRR